MPRMRKYFSKKLVLVYFFALMFVFMKFYNFTIDSADNEELAFKLSKLEGLSEELSRNLTDTQVDLLDILTRNNHSRFPVIPPVMAQNPAPDHEIEEIDKSTEKLVYVHFDGTVIVNKTLLVQKLERSLWRWNHTRQIVAFMHIGKSGGTSFRSGLLKATNDRGCKLKSTGIVRQPKEYTCPGSLFCVCNKHYDWTTIETMNSKVSHFYFAQNLPWTKGTTMRKQSLKSYLSDPQSMLNTRDVWQDGQVVYIDAWK